MAYAFYASIAHPRWVEPLLSLDERIARESAELQKLEMLEEEVFEARHKYRALLDRVGSFDELVVRNDLRRRLNDLIARYNLEGAGTTPSRPQEDRKTGVKTMHLTVTATGTLESAVGFMRDVSELPHLIRVGNASIYPATTSRRAKGPSAEERVNIRVPIEVKVLPRQKMLETPLRDDELRQPSALVRHEERDYRLIWEAKPFTEFIPLKPLVVQAGTDVNVEVGQRVSLEGKAVGGDGRYHYSWVPEERLSDVKSPRPKVDTAEPINITYVLTVEDESGNSSEDSVTLSVREKPKPETIPTVAEAIKEPPLQPTAKRWTDRQFMQLSMTLARRQGNSRIEEVMVFNNKTKETAYYPLLGQFDGGTLVGVHPRGGIVRREDGGEAVYYVYPIGESLDREIRAEEANDFPVLRSLALQIREAEAALGLNRATGGTINEEGPPAPQAPGVPGTESARPEGASSAERAAKPSAASKEPSEGDAPDQPAGAGAEKARTVQDAARNKVSPKTRVKGPGKRKPNAARRSKKAEGETPEIVK